MSRYYELKDDRRSHIRWHLGGPIDEQGQEIDPWQFRKGWLLKSRGVLRFPLDVPGKPLDFSWAAFAIPVVSGRLVQLFEQLRIQKVQFIPAPVEAHSEPYFFLNALRIIPCIDEARCTEVQHWRHEDGQPEKVGEYRSIAGMRIDSSKVGDAHIFRPWGWRIALVLSEMLKQAMEAEEFSGMRFVEV
jgi:hypothetical protein